MKQVKYFFPWSDDPITQEQFIDFYNKCYYLNNSSIVETEIEGLLHADALSKDNVMLILRWKLGRIDHKKSQIDGVVRTKDNDGVFKTFDGRGRLVDATEFCEYVSRELATLRTNPTQETLKSLIKNSPENIGSVSLITVLYFVTQGDLPIYDRFAAVALDAILAGKKPGAMIEYKSLPQKNEQSFKERLLSSSQHSLYQQYIELLCNLFGNCYKCTRDIDRALWVYGHLFQIKE